MDEKLIKFISNNNPYKGISYSDYILRDEKGSYVAFKIFEFPNKIFISNRVFNKENDNYINEAGDKKTKYLVGEVEIYPMNISFMNKIELNAIAVVNTCNDNPNRQRYLKFMVDNLIKWFPEEIEFRLYRLNHFKN